ncbi:MAG: hypothetical protein ABIM74_07530 [candidate division WOR-3 bacterium]
MFFRRKKISPEITKKVGIPSRSGHDVARFPMQAPILVVFGLGEQGVQVSCVTLDLPKDTAEKVMFIRENCDVLLAYDANRDFLNMLMDEGLEIYITDDRRPEAALYSFLAGKLDQFLGGPCPSCGKGLA